MDAFEEWHEAEMLVIKNRFARWFERKFKPIKRYVWRSALGWLYDQLGYSEEHKQIKDIISDELGE